ncbi:MAG: WYL domain-containing protein [Thermodesulfobacteriota bacterium]
MMRRILKMIWSGSKRVSGRGRSILGVLFRENLPPGSGRKQARDFRLLGQAIRTGQLVTFSYPNKGKEERYRSIFPRKLFRRKETIYCRMFDPRRKEYRAFRLDKMNELKIDLRRDTWRRMSQKIRSGPQS